MKSLHKKAIELSINFLIVIILSIVMLTLGIALITNFFTTTEEVRQELDTQTIAELSSLLEQGQLSAIAFNRQKIPAGESGIFVLGILNANTENTFFRVEIVFSGAYTGDNQQINIENAENWLLYSNNITLGPQEKGSIPINVKVPEGIQKGTYIYTVKVNQNYGVKKIYVVV